MGAVLNKNLLFTPICQRNEVDSVQPKKKFKVAERNRLFFQEIVMQDYFKPNPRILSLSIPNAALLVYRDHGSARRKISLLPTEEGCDRLLRIPSLY